MPEIYSLYTTINYNDREEEASVYNLTKKELIEDINTTLKEKATSFVFVVVKMRTE